MLDSDRCDRLSKYELLHFKQNYYKRMYDKMKQIIPTLSLQTRVKLFELNKFKIKTQYYDNYISRISFAIPNVNDQFRLSYYSFEIKDNILDYSPSSAAVEGYDEQCNSYLPLNPLLADNNQSRLMLTETEFFLFKQTKKQISLNKIVELLIKERNMTFDLAQKKTLQFYEKLENLGLLYYSKLFK